MEKKLIYTIDEKYINEHNLDSSYLNKNIVIYSDRYDHISKHKNEFSDISSYNNAINNIDYIVSSPDFIVIDNKRNCLEFIKTMDDNVLVAVRISKSNDLKVKTLYPISETKKNKLYNDRTSNQLKF